MGSLYINYWDQQTLCPEHDSSFVENFSSSSGQCEDPLEILFIPPSHIKQPYPPITDNGKLCAHNVCYLLFPATKHQDAWSVLLRISPLSGWLWVLLPKSAIEKNGGKKRPICMEMTKYNSLDPKYGFQWGPFCELHFAFYKRARSGLV